MNDFTFLFDDSQVVVVVEPDGLGTTDSIKQQTAITATREAYRACGKALSRYRPSAEALRRLLRGLNYILIVGV